MTEQYLVAIDPALSNTGIALRIGDERSAQTIKSAAIARGNDDPHAHSSRIERTAAAIAYEIPNGALVAIEGPAFNAKYGNPDERAGLRWSIIARLRVRGCRVVIMPPAVGKTWLTDQGNATKDMMLSAVSTLLPGIARNEHEADALAMLLALEYNQGRSTPITADTAKRKKAYEKVSWAHLKGTQS